MTEGRSDEDVDVPIVDGASPRAVPEGGLLKERIDILEQRLHDVELGGSPDERPSQSRPSGSGAQPKLLSSRRRVLDVGAAVAVMALIFSFSTFVLGQRTQDREDRREARAQLAELTRKVNTLSFDLDSPQAQVGTPTPDLSAAAVQRSIGIGTEMNVLIAQIEQIERDHPDIFSAVDYYILGWAHMYHLDAVSARKAYEQADRVATEQSLEFQEFAAKRGLAGALFFSKDFEGGRRVYSQVIKLSEERQDPRQPRHEAEGSYTRASWALSELAAGHCAEATAQLHAFQSARNASSTPWLYDRLSSLTEQVTAGLNDCR